MNDRFVPAINPQALDEIPESRSWESFVTAKTADEFCRAWLALLCIQLEGTRAAAILVESAAAQTFVPIAAWPEPAPDLGRLSRVVERALGESRGVVQPASPEDGSVTHIAYPIFIDQRVVGAIALEAACDGTQVQVALRQIHWGSAWLSNLFAKHEWDEAIRGKERVSAVLETLAIALRQGKFQQVLFEVSNDLRQRFSCSRVAIGLVDQSTIKLASLSEAASFEKGAPLVKAYTRAMEEAYDHGVAIYQNLDGPAVSDDKVKATPYLQHMALLAHAGATKVLSYPLSQGGQCLGVITLEKSDETDFSAADQAWLDAFATLFAPIVEQRRAAERSSLARIVGELKQGQARLFGPRHLVWKAGAFLSLGFVALLSLLQLDYRVGAKTVIEGEVQRVAAAPFEGFIGAAYVRAGDSVKQGQLLAELDDHDLLVEQARWASERDQYDNKLREAMAKHDLTAVQVVGAQLRQAQAQWSQVADKLVRAKLTAPYDGVVISGDLSQQIGTPVEAGKKLFEVAPLASYRVILQVDEREIRHVQLGQAGRLVISGIAAESMPLTVVKLTSVATAEDGKNFFRVEARLQQAPKRLRPGMEGVGKIEVGSRSLWWILTHSFTDWLTLTLWTWSW